MSGPSWGGPVGGCFIEVDGKPVHEPDAIRWARWVGTADRVVAKTVVGGWEVSTVFLGINHNFFNNGPPILYETMIFETRTVTGELFHGRSLTYHPSTDEQWRYATREEARAHHQKIVAGIRRRLHAERASLKRVK